MDNSGNFCYDYIAIGRELDFVLQRMTITRERQNGEGEQCIFRLADITQEMPRIVKEYEEKVQMIYLDPPFSTGDKFVLRQRVGEEEWQKGTGSLSVLAYSDRQGREEYLAMLRIALEGSKQLLKDEGSIFVHVDYRAHAYVRLLMDEIFGEENLVNEIIWAYQSGGRSRRSFSHKHDIILFYRKTPKAYFDIDAVSQPRGPQRNNHMKRMIDADGRVYRTIRSAGKIYTYYDDDPINPSDVWTDVSHLQQKDPQRTGYDTQKPMSLLQRLIACCTRPGDLVMDFFCGSGTTMETAWRMGRKCLCTDNSGVAYFTTRRRMQGANILYEADAEEGSPVLQVSALMGIAYYEMTLEGYTFEDGVYSGNAQGLDVIDNWSCGYVRDGIYRPMVYSQRSKQSPKLKSTLQLPVYPGEIAICTGDIVGRVLYWKMQEEDAGKL